MSKYNFKQIEKKWQEIWEKCAKDLSAKDFDEREKVYNLVEFPYPSGAGLHVGHCMGYGASDAYARMKRMQGKNVLFPIGWDAFGLPTENYAIKTGISPQKATADNIETFRKQMKSIAISFDFDREVNTTDPDYYRWTQWIFLQFYKHAIVDGKLIKVTDNDTTTPRLAFQSEMPINWCPSCKIGLSNEEVINGKCERCGAETEKRSQKQWMLRITAYADRLIKDLDTVDYLPKIKTSQINWIGKSTGTNIIFKLKNSDEKIEVFTTRADTLFGVTYVVLAPEHDLVTKLKKQSENEKEIDDYIKVARGKSDLERTELQKDKTGVEIKGIKAINPINGEEVSVWVADYVLANYGTGAVMAVPAHDERDWEFAKKYDIPITEVVMPFFGEKHEGEESRHTVQAFVRNKDGKYMALKWKEFGWLSFPLGGIDGGETPEEAVVREVMEETGYKIKAIEKIGGVYESHFYADNKKVWRERYDQPVLCELVDETPAEVAEDEKNRHEPIWMSAKELLEKITHKDNLVGLERLLRGNYSSPDYGRLINSGDFTGLTSEEGKKKITEKLKELGAGDFSINYKLRDWIFSRQHYWGEPIPIIHCDKCGIVPVPEAQLPVTLPIVEKYQPTDSGESPLAGITDWVETVCPVCGGKARRETDTMPNWAGSSWYSLAYAMQGCSKLKIQNPKGNIFEEKKKELDYWMPVDLYNGGMEHTTLHLLYSRFWHKFLYDLGVVPGAEPYQKRIAHGIILGADGRKMSKSFGNTISPDEIVGSHGADALRAYIMFIGPYDQESAWNNDGLSGVSRFLSRVWENSVKVSDDESAGLISPINELVKEVEGDIETHSLNTYIAKLMTFNNLLSKEEKVDRKILATYCQLLAPAAPHMAEEIWETIGQKGSIFQSTWPKYDSSIVSSDLIKIAVQVNGKLRDIVEAEKDAPEEVAKKLALESEKVKSAIEGKEVVKVIVVPNKIVSIVIK